jgi:hypothetical protein
MAIRSPSRMVAAAATRCNAMATTLRAGDLSPARRFGTSTGFRRLYWAVVIVQGVHMFEHIVQLIQVYGFGVPDDDALGLLGYVFAFNGTEEWLHFVFNMTYLMSLAVLFVGVLGLYFEGVLSTAIFIGYLVLGLGMEAWHGVEHVVIIRNVIRNGGCPCPGIGDAALGVTDTQLHFVYNLIAYTGTILPFVILRKAGRLPLLARSARPSAPSTAPN